MVWIILAAAANHTLWGIGSLIWPEVRENAFVHNVGQIFPGGGLATILIFASVLSLVGVSQIRTRPLIALVLALPQQFLLMLSIRSFSYNLATSTVPEVSGTLPPGVIFPAFAIIVSLGVCHTLAILDQPFRTLWILYRSK